MRKTVSIKKNSDGTITVSSGGYKEQVDTRFKEVGTIFEEIKWAIIGAGIPFSLEIEELVREVLEL